MLENLVVGGIKIGNKKNFLEVLNKYITLSAKK